jgi:FixJ family two-component response regulator
MSATEIFILEDDLTMRAMLKVILEQSGYQPVFFVDGDALQAESRRRCPACILLDVQVPGRSGLEILSDLRDADCQAPILMVSGHGNIAIAVQSLKSGAADFIEKPFAATDLIGRIARVVATSTIAPARAPSRPRDWQPLTHREREVLDHLLAGASSKAIAKQLDISPRTIEGHRANIMRKMGVRTAAQLMAVTLSATHESVRALSEARPGGRRPLPAAGPGRAARAPSITALAG